MARNGPHSGFSDLPDPGGARTVDDLVALLRALKVWAGGPSYDTIRVRINRERTAAGRPAAEAARRSTVADSFKPGRRRLDPELIVAIVRALHPDPGYVAQWTQAMQVVGGERRAAAQVRVHHELPPDLPGFTGRAGDLRRLRRALTSGGPVVISAIEGMAGVGKTRLAVRAAHLLHRERPFDRVLFVNLRGFHPDPAQPPADPAAVLDGFLRLLGVPGPDIPHDPAAKARLYRDRVAGVRALVVLDNAADADQIGPLLPGTPNCAVLITSRRSLAAVRPATSIVVDVFTPSEALRYLTRETGSTVVGEDPDAATRIADLCGRLPLALGLVTAHILTKPGWTLTDHADRLEERRRHRHLDGGVELALDLSYRSLGDDRQRLLRLLALHPADDVDDYAAAALTGTTLADARAGLRQLGADHLVQSVGSGRYTLHDLVRVYATGRAHDDERPAERRAALTRLFDHYLGTAVAAMRTLHPGEIHRLPEVAEPATPAPSTSDHDAAVAWLESEHLALVAVVAYTAEHGWPGHTVRLARTLFRHLTETRHRDALTVHEQAARAAGRAGDVKGRAHALTDLAIACSRRGRSEDAAGHFLRAIELCRTIGDVAGQGRAVMSLGNLEGHRGRYETAARHHRQAFDLFEEAGDRNGAATALLNIGVTELVLGIGVTELVLGRLDEATGYMARSLAISRDTGDTVNIAYILNSMGQIAIESGRPDVAVEHFDESLDLYRKTGSRSGASHALHGLGMAYTRLGRPEEAIAYHEQTLAAARETGDRKIEVWALNGLGEATGAADRPAEAQAHYGAALALAVDIAAPDQEARAYAGLGDVHDRLGDPAAARKSLERSLRLFADLGLPEADEIRARLVAAAR